MIKFMQLYPKAAALACTTAVILLAGCGRSGDTSTEVSPAIAAKPDAIVTVDGEHHTCIVALYSEAQGSAISCDDVVAFMKDELRLKSGSVYDMRTIPNVDPAVLTKVETNLQSAGYRFIGGHRIAR